MPYVVSPRGMLEKDLIERKSAIWKAALIGFVEKRQSRRRCGDSRHQRPRGGRGGGVRILAAPSLAKFRTASTSIEPTARASPAIAARDRSSGPYVLFLGRINWKKGLDRLIEAMAARAGRSTSIVAGNDEEGYTSGARIARAARRALRDRVIFAGPVHGARQDGADRAARARWSCRRIQKILATSSSRRWPPAGPSIVSRGSWRRRSRSRAAACGLVIDGRAEQLGRRDRAACRTTSAPVTRWAAAASDRWRRAIRGTASPSQMEALYESLQRPAPMLNEITPLILTFNEAPNIGRTLDRLSWATRHRGRRQREHRRHARDRVALSRAFACSSAHSRRTRSSGTSASDRQGSRPSGCWRSMPTSC